MGGNSEPSSAYMDLNQAGRLCCPDKYILENQHIPAKERDLDIRSPFDGILLKELPDVLRSGYCS